ncbi:MAG: MoxR family ATPase [Spirochaetaceae bacterium]|nr:MoxR family ATPase [Spirochaetaceae bacterium]MBO7486213.1 MoxR family ATPase [Spirochaetaceae bacterium]
MNKIEETASKIKKSLFSAFKGKPEVVDLVLTALFAGGHVLLEDVPGTGKTVLAKALAKSVNLPFSRIQCTPDLLPSDVTGSSIWIPGKQEFEFRAGPVMASIVLVDELNRATPRTQSSLLECMAEGQVSVDGNHYSLGTPFFVIATENPVESEGTFPLPEAQKDRFMLTVSIGYPSVEDEIKIITGQNTMQHPVDLIQPVAEKQDVVECMEQVLSVHVDEAVLSYLISLSAVTRQDERIAAGVSPRGSIALYKAGQAYAALNGRNFVTPEDIKLLAEPVFRKRLILKSDAILKGYTEESIIKELLQTVPVPAFRAHV